MQSTEMWLYMQPESSQFFFYKVLKFKELIRINKIKTSKGLNGYSFSGFYKTKSIFIHIPKCGGISINQSLYHNKGGGHIQAWKYKLILPYEFDSFFKFSIVRNPWDRLHSAYTFLKKGGCHIWDRLWYEKHLQPFQTFENFVHNWLSKENIMKGQHFYPQYLFVTNNKKEIIVDYIGRMENLENSFDIILSKIPVSAPIQLEHLNKTESKGLKTYRDAYSPTMIEKVKNIYKEDIDLFEYEF